MLDFLTDEDPEGLIPFGLIFTSMSIIFMILWFLGDLVPVSREVYILPFIFVTAYAVFFTKQNHILTKATLSFFCVYLCSRLYMILTQSEPTIAVYVMALSIVPAFALLILWVFLDLNRYLIGIIRKNNEQQDR